MLYSPHFWWEVQTACVASNHVPFEDLLAHELEMVECIEHNDLIIHRLTRQPLACKTKKALIFCFLTSFDVITSINPLSQGKGLFYHIQYFCQIPTYKGAKTCMLPSNLALMVWSSQKWAGNVSNLELVELNWIRPTPVLDCYLLIFWSWKCLIHALPFDNVRYSHNASSNVNYFHFKRLSKVWFIRNKHKQQSKCIHGLSPVKKMLRDRTKVMLDRRGPEPGPGPLLTLEGTCCMHQELIQYPCERHRFHHKAFCSWRMDSCHTNSIGLGQKNENSARSKVNCHQNLITSVVHRYTSSQQVTSMLSSRSSVVCTDIETHIHRLTHEQTLVKTISASNSTTIITLFCLPRRTRTWTSCSTFKNAAACLITRTSNYEHGPSRWRMTTWTGRLFVSECSTSLLWLSIVVFGTKLHGTSLTTVCKTPKFLVTSICDQPDVIDYQFCEFAAALLGPMHSLSPDQQSGIHCLIICVIQLLTLNNLAGSWRRICFAGHSKC